MEYLYSMSSVVECLPSMSSVVEYLPSKGKAIDLIPRMVKNLEWKVKRKLFWGDGSGGKMFVT